MAGPISNDYINMINKKGSGYNIPVIVDAIVKSEIDPVKASVTARKVIADAAISGLASLKASARLTQTAVNGLNSLNDYSLSTSTTGTLTMTTSDSTNISSFSKNISHVVTAKAQVLSVNNFNADAVGNGALQTLTIVVGPDAQNNSATSTVNIIATDNVLTIAEKLNNVVGLKAEVIDIGTGTRPLRLVITGDLGTVGNFTISSGLAGGSKISTTPHDANTAVQGSRNASLSLDGVTINRSTNTISDLVGGVTINLLKDDTATTKITSSLSATKVQATVEKMIAELNLYKEDMEVLGFMDSKNNANGDLAQNSYLRSAQRELDRLISTPLKGYTVNGVRNADIYFVDFGVKTTKSGTLEFDQKIFNQTFTREPEKFDALTLDVAYSSDPNVKVYALPTSGMPTGGHAFANHQRVLPTSSTSSIGGFRSFNDKLVGGTTINYSQNPQHGRPASARNISIQTNAGETVTSFISRLNALSGLTATATTTGNPAHRSIAFSITQDTQDTHNVLDTGTRLTMTMTGDMNNRVIGVPVIREYRSFGSATEILPTQPNFIIHGNSFNISGHTPSEVADLINGVGGLTAVMAGSVLRITGPSSGASISTPTIRNAAGYNNNFVETQARVAQQADSVGAMSNHRNETNEVWQDVVNVIPASGGFTKVDTNGADSSVGTGAGTYSSTNYPGFTFTTANDQGAMTLYVGRSVRTLMNNFFNDALASTATHNKVSDLYTGKSNSLAERLTQIDEREALLRTKYTSQFAAMETVVTGGSSTSEYLESMVAAWRKD